MVESEYYILGEDEYKLEVPKDVVDSIFGGSSGTTLRNKFGIQQSDADRWSVELARDWISDDFRDFVNRVKEKRAEADSQADSSQE